MPGSAEKVFYNFLQLNCEDRRWILQQIANRSDDDTINMFVSAAAVFSADQFEEAKQRLKKRGYVPLANPQAVEQ